MRSWSPELQWYFSYDALGIFMQTSELLEVADVLVDVENIARRRMSRIVPVGIIVTHY